LITFENTLSMTRNLLFLFLAGLISANINQIIEHKRARRVLGYRHAGDA